MPTRPPAANWTQARPAQGSTKAFDLSCAAIGAAAIGLAAFIDWGCYDRAGAVLVLLMAGVLVAVLGRATARGRPPAQPFG
jgi:hypothetical protein